MEPTRFGPYTLIERIAKGGMAEVFAAKRDGARQICVLKRLLVELESHETAGKRFYREAHVASFLRHRNIASVIDAGFEDNRFYIAMDFIPGQDAESMMHHLMRQGRMLPYQVSLAIIAGVLEGLAYAHEMKDPAGRRLDLVHRDLSPRNMMVGYSGDIRIIDFGLARGKVDGFRTAPGMLLGTLRYVSPEQAMTTPVDHRSDLYTVSVVLWEMLSGHILVPEGKPADLLEKVIQEAPPPLSRVNPHLPPALDAVVQKGLSKAREDRFRDAAEYRDALQSAAGSLLDISEQALGGFVRKLFPAEYNHAIGLLESNGGHAPPSPAADEAGDIVERLWTLTHGNYVQPTALEERSEEAGVTRTGRFDREALLGANAQTGIVRRAQSQPTPAHTALVTRVRLRRTAGPRPTRRPALANVALVTTVCAAAAVMVALWGGPGPKPEPQGKAVLEIPSATVLRPPATRELAMNAPPAALPGEPVPKKTTPRQTTKRPRRIPKQKSRPPVTAGFDPPEPYDDARAAVARQSVEPSKSHFDHALSELYRAAALLPADRQPEVARLADQASWLRESRRSWPEKQAKLEAALNALEQAAAAP